MIAFSDIDFAWLAKVFSLAVLPFAHEDLAIVMGGYIVVNRVMPVGLVLACIYFGMVASDFVLYGIGAGARRLPWLSQWAVDDRVRNFGDALKRNLFGLAALCRVVPGVVFVAFIACGWSRVSLARFTTASLLVSALYLPLMLYLIVIFGDALDDHAGQWAWPLLLCLVVAAGFMRYRVFALHEDEPVAAETASAPAARKPRTPARLFRARPMTAKAAPLRPLRLAKISAIPRAAKWLRLS